MDGLYFLYFFALAGHLSFQRFDSEDRMDWALLPLITFFIATCLASPHMLGTHETKAIGSDGHIFLYLWNGGEGLWFLMAVHSLWKSDTLWPISVLFSGDSPNTPCRLFFTCPKQPSHSPSEQCCDYQESEARARVRKPPIPSLQLRYLLATLWHFILLFFATTCLLFFA